MSENQERMNTGRIDLFNPNSLTPEEADLMRKLRHEATWKHGYPMGLITGGVIALLTRKMSLAKRFACTIVGGITGNIIGKISFVPVIQQRIVSDLPETSPLRQKVEEMQQKGVRGIPGFSPLKDPVDNVNEHNLQFDTGSEYESHNMEPESNVDKPKKYTSYQELRKKHREEDKTTAPSSNRDSFGILDHGPVSDINTDIEPRPQPTESLPNKKIRYNKYGDPIIE